MTLTHPLIDMIMTLIDLINIHIIFINMQIILICKLITARQRGVKGGILSCRKWKR
jgi:hypothetical protein